MEQLKKDENKIVINVLQSQRDNETFNQWKQLDIKLTDALNEAKDNMKYLSSLEKYIEPLYTGSPTQIIDILPGLMKNIRMMHSIARYYSTNERMTTLFKKITHQMISNCKATINKPGRLWDQDMETLITNLKACMKLNEEYQKAYRYERVCSEISAIAN